MKKFKGFTLVELIVVIAIIGVLAAILVPNMMGYISKSKLSSANTAAKNVQTAVVTYVADQESMGKTVSLSLATSSGEVKSMSGQSGNVDAAIYNALQGNSNMGYVAVGMIDGTTKAATTTYSSSVVVWAQWADSSSHNIIGQYPDAQSDYTAYKKTPPTWGTFKSLDATPSK